MGLDVEYIDGETPLDEDEKDVLLIATIATRGELDEFEQQNIEQAIQWALTWSFKPEAILIMLDFDLAELYEVETRVLNLAIKRNIDSFPKDFISG